MTSSPPSRGSRPTTDCVKTLTGEPRNNIKVQDQVEEYITEDNPVRFIGAFAPGLES